MEYQTYLEAEANFLRELGLKEEEQEVLPQLDWDQGQQRHGYKQAEPGILPELFFFFFVRYFSSFTCTTFPMLCPVCVWQYFFYHVIKKTQDEVQKGINQCDVQKKGCISQPRQSYTGIVSAS